MSSSGILDGFWSGFKMVLSKEYRSLTAAERDIINFMLSKASGVRCSIKQADLAKQTGLSLTTVKSAYKRLKDLRIIALDGYATIVINPAFFHEQKAYPETYKRWEEDFNDVYDRADKKASDKAAVVAAHGLPWSEAEMSAFSRGEESGDD